MRVTNGRLPQTRTPQPTNFHPERLVNMLFKVTYTWNVKEWATAGVEHCNALTLAPWQLFADGRRRRVQVNPLALDLKRTTFLSANRWSNSVLDAERWGPAVWFIYNLKSLCGPNYLIRSMVIMTGVKPIAKTREKDQYLHLLILGHFRIPKYKIILDRIVFDQLNDQNWHT